MQATLERLRARREQGHEGGFTLIELLIVIVVLAILAAIVVFAVTSVTGSSAKASCESDIQTVDHAVEAYEAQMAVTTVPNETALLTTAVAPDGNTVGPWLHNTPVNGGHYAISVTPAGNTITVLSGSGGAIKDNWVGGGSTWKTSAVYTASATNAGATACKNVAS